MKMKNEKRGNVKCNLKAGQAVLSLFFFSLALIILLPAVSADLGCCFDINTGFCSPGTEPENCKAANTQFFSSSNCAAAAECVLGCCNLGTDFPFITQRECELRSEQKGFDFNWIDEDSESCRFRELASEEGACILGTYRDKCKILTREKCATGDFTSDANCVDLKIYNQTENTICHRESVYFKDTAGNPAALKEECKYDEGRICKQKSAKESYCADLNCVDNKGIKRKNGEAWCYFDLGGQYYDIEEIYSDGELNGAPVGSRFFSKYCLNGEIVTEPCADYRMEFCSKGKCEINKWEDCLFANSFDSETGEAKLDEEACDETYCYTKIPMDCVASGGKNFCGSKREDYRGSSTGGSDAKEYASKPLEALNLNLCVPKIPGGFDFYGSKQLTSEGEGSSVCSMGNLIGELTFGWHGSKGWGLGGPTGGNDLYFKPGTGGTGNSNYGDIALAPRVGEMMISAKPPYKSWRVDDYELDHLEGIFTDLASTVGADKKVMSLLGERCGVISDCEGKLNWVNSVGGSEEGDAKKDEENSSEEGILYRYGGAARTSKYSFEYSCGDFAQPVGDSDCGKCGKEGLVCSEYRCMALGKNCEYSEPSGADKGFCVSSSDRTPPKITLKGINPASPVKPYEPVEISILTNEAAACKFTLNSPPGKFDTMNFKFGEDYNFEHNIKLNIPGQIAGLRGNITEYPLLTADGKYKMYVRCVDVRGNGEIMSPLIITFEVMKTPDTKIFPPRNFNPVSGSPIKYETTSRYITFEMLEPAECRWDFSDKEYEKMTNEFDCDTGISVNPTKNYKCSGILTNITANKTIKYERQVVCRETSSGEVCREESVDVTGVNSEGKKFYIRCKDQPELENDSVIIKGITYSRNTMQTGFVYELRNSDPLKITEVSPSGKVYVGLKDSFELAAFTSSGANNGVARCLWKISNKSDFSGTSYTSFKTTNSTIHKNLLNANLLFGYNYVSIRCTDSADNIAYLNSTFNLILDKTSPKAISLSKSFDNLKIKTNEAAKCYYSFDNIKRCLFAKENSTEMQTSDNYAHTAGWQNDKTFYIKCEDLKENLAAGCTISVDTRAYTEF